MTSFHSVSMFDDRGGPPPLRPLTAVELRVLGTLIEKQQATPEAYPLTLNSILNGCNQQTGRNPVMQLEESEVSDALEALAAERLVRQVSGARSTRWEHMLDYRLGLDSKWRAVLALLFLRGPQTPGEIRNRSERLYSFRVVEEVEEVLQAMAERSRPLVMPLRPREGQKEARWAHLLGARPEPEAESAGSAENVESPVRRLQRLEKAVEDLLRELDALKEKLGTG